MYVCAYVGIIVVHGVEGCSIEVGSVESKVNFRMDQISFILFFLANMHREGGGVLLAKLTSKHHTYFNPSPLHCMNYHMNGSRMHFCFEHENHDLLAIFQLMINVAAAIIPASALLINFHTAHSFHKSSQCFKMKSNFFDSLLLFVCDKTMNFHNYLI